MKWAVAAITAAVEFGLDRPAAKRGREPGVVPAVKGRVRVGGVAGEPVAQPAFAVGAARFFDAGSEIGSTRMCGARSTAPASAAGNDAA